MKVKYIGAFIISFIVGMIFICISPVEYKTVVVYPTPSNLEKIQYKDKANNCYKFDATEVKCPTDTSLIKKIPIQK